MRTPAKPTISPDLVWAGRVPRLAAAALCTGALALSSCSGDEALGPVIPPPADLVFMVQPTATMAGAIIAPALEVAIHDAEGNLVTTATDLVTMAITGGPDGSALFGTLEVAAVDGIATLRGLSIDQPGTGYTLTASAAGLTAATTHPFRVYVVGMSAAEQDESGTFPKSGLFEVFASVETADGGSADDPAIWIHPTDPSLSLIIGADKSSSGGLHVYSLDGTQLQFVSGGRHNNVDVRYGFMLGGESVDLVSVSERDADNIDIYKVDPVQRTLIKVGSINTGINVYGYAMYHNRLTGKFYGFVSSSGGDIEQWELLDQGTSVGGQKVREFDAGTKVEGMVADDELGFLYIGEENVAIWKYGAEPGDGTARTKVDETGSPSQLTDDIEGLTIYYGGEGKGYLIASSEGNDRFVVYRREGDNDYMATFEIGAGAVDAVTGTDGIDVTNMALGSGYPLGVFVAQDGGNYKLVPWDAIANAIGLAIDTDGYDVRGGGSTAPVASVDVSPATATIAPGATIQLTAQLTDTDNNTLIGRVVTWSSDAVEFATVSPNGLVTAVAEGGATITATSEGIPGTSVITVLFVPVASVDVSPASGTIAVGASIQLTAQPKDEVGNPLAGRVVTWSSSNTGVATVAADGLVTGVGEGTATITATSETKSGDAAIEVYAPPPGSTPPNFKVAFIGDQDDGSGAMNVLRLIRDEGTDMVIHLGDFDYSSDPDGWDNLITSVLGFDYPYFATIGNHDTGEWSTYQQKLEERLARVDGATCTGDLGVKSACTYQGLFFILSGAGTRGSGHESYIRQELSQDNSDWRICSWHKVQREMQVGGKSSSVGWGPYRACREEGAIIATAHEHSYSRTKTLVSMEQQIVDPDWPDPNDVYVGPGATFAFVSGLGGKSIRDQERCKPTTYPYGCKGEWANIYTSDQNAKFGALFIEFHVDGDPGKARGYFKNVNGQIIDEFTITGTGVSSNSAPTVGGVLDQTTDEGATTTLAATFSDADTEDTHTASIDWGDGTPPEAGTVSKLVVPWTVSATHAYADDGDYTVTVSVSDGRGGVGQGSYTVTVSNVAPTAVAGGPYSGDEGSPISFSGSATDPGADALTFEWDFDYDGSTFDDVEGGGPTPQHTYLQDGEFTVGLRVSDGDGGVSTVVTAAVKVNDVDPVADFSFSPSAPTVDEPVSFTDASISYDGITWEWDFDTSTDSDGDGAADNDVNSTDQNPTHIYDVADTYTVRLTVSETDGGVSTVEKQVEVVEQLVAPTVDGGLDQTTDEGATTTLAATFSDADTEDTHTASIDWGDGTPPEAGTVSKLVVPWTVSATHAYADDGDYTVTVSVSDGRGGVGQGSYTVTVSNVAPTAVAGGPYSGDEGSPISFSGSATDPGADVLTFEWDFDYDGVTFIANGGGASPQHTYLQDGDFTVALRVSDDDGGVSGVATAPVTIKDTDPMADFSFSPAAPTIGDPVSFTDASTSYDGITSWEWNFDIFDISSGLDLLSIEQNPSHTYDVAGIYTVRLTVREADGDVSTVDKQVEVGEQLVTSTVLYFSLSKSTTVGGLSVANEDIIAFDGTGFSKYFDGSDVGVGGHRIDGFVIISSNEIIMSFSSSGSVPGISGTVDDSDIVKFTATSLGTNTAGSFELYFDGSDVGLTRSGEDIDAIELLPDGRLLISTRGSFSVPGLSGKDEDISVFTPTSLGPTTAGTWARYFDGSDVSLGSSSDEDIYALAVDATGKIYLSTKGNFSVSGLSGHDEDVFVFTPSSLGSSTAGTFDSTLFFDGSAYGLSSNDIYGIDLR